MVPRTKLNSYGDFLQLFKGSTYPVELIAQECSDATFQVLLNKSLISGYLKSRKLLLGYLRFFSHSFSSISENDRAQKTLVSFKVEHKTHLFRKACNVSSFPYRHMPLNIKWKWRIMVCLSSHWDKQN